MLDSLHIKNFRCFEDLTIPSLGRVNLIVGKNSVGKTTLLEAIDILGNDGVIHHIRTTLQQRSSEEFEHLFSSKNESSMYIGNSQHTLGIEINLTHETLSVKAINGEIEKTPIKDHQKPKEITIPDGKTPQEIFDLIFNASNWVRLNSSSVYSRFSTTTIKSEESFHSLVGMLSTDDDFKDTGLKIKIIEWMRIINDKITDISFSKKENGLVIAMVKVDGKPDAIPLKSMGEGIRRLLQILLLGFESGMFSGEYGDFLLIDEFENGLHYSIQEEVWEKLFKLAKELDIQVFATTHSEDTVKAFCKVAVADKEVDGKLIALARSAKTSNEGQIFPIIYEENTLQTFIDMGMEVR